MSRATVFISYSHSDEKEKELLVSHLGVLARGGLLDLWVDDRIGAGEDWKPEIEKAMASARVGLLLVTANFLTSDFILQSEVPRLLERRRRDGLTVFPVIARDCAWRRIDWLARMNVRPKNGAPVWREQGAHADEELARIAEEVAGILDTRERAAAGVDAPETVLVPEGTFQMGDGPDTGAAAHEGPRHPVELSDFRIAAKPVTHDDYARFVRDAGHPAPKKAGWFGNTPPAERLDHPVVGVTWFDARAYCAWLEERTGERWRLPSEAEWEKAARGTEARVYPWGSEWEPGRAAWGGSETSPVGAHPEGASPYGCLDMAGNVWEWTLSLWGRDWQTSDFTYPYRPDDGREDPEAPEVVHRIFRGGSFADEPAQLRASARRWFAPGSADPRRGFRVALDV